MRNFRRFTLVSAALFVAFFVILFILENTQSVVLLFLGWPAPQFPVSVYMLLAFLAGMMLGPLLVWFVGLRRRLK